MPTSNPSGERRRVTVWPQGSILFLTRIRYPCDSRSAVAFSTLSTSNSNHACGTGDAVHYVYADPLVCGCLYVGTQQAYDQYKRDQQQKNLADEQQMTAQTYSDAAWNWNAWGPWGPPVRPYGFVYGPAVGW
jgi:hypothetical protein